MRIPVDIAVTAGIWVAVQGNQALSTRLIGGTAAPAVRWSEWGITGVIGTLLGQLFGNALCEELVYRGFLLTQVLFATCHISSALAGGMSAIDVVLDLIRLTVLGILLALLYVRTNNLFIVIGVHALMNAPTALVSSPTIDVSVLVILLAALPSTSPAGRAGKRRPGNRDHGDLDAMASSRSVRSNAVAVIGATNTAMNCRVGPPPQTPLSLSKAMDVLDQALFPALSCGPWFQACPHHGCLGQPQSRPQGKGRPSNHDQDMMLPALDP